MSNQSLSCQVNCLCRFGNGKGRKQLCVDIHKAFRIFFRENIEIWYRQNYYGCNKHFSEHWKMLPREAVEPLSLEILKMHPDMVLWNQPQVNLLEQGAWTRWPLEVPSNPNCYVILWCSEQFWKLLCKEWPGISSSLSNSNL